MQQLKAPNEVDDHDNYSLSPEIFLAGSIEMGAAENWQDKLVRDLSVYEGIIWNPRRDDWDSSWEQKASNPQFNQQVTWELDHIENVDLVVFYFDPNTKSPITLMELGYVLGIDMDIVVCCPDGFWRKGNVEILCERQGIHICNTYDMWLEEIETILADWQCL